MFFSRYTCKGGTHVGRVTLTCEGIHRRAPELQAIAPLLATPSLIVGIKPRTDVCS